MRHRLGIFILAAFMVLFVGCNPIADKSSAESVMNEYFAAIKDKDFDKALGFYSQQFFDKTSRESWNQSLRAVNSKLGDLQSYEQTGWRIQATTGLGPAGTWFIFQYRVTYSKYPSDEEVILFKPAGSNEIKILQHQIMSEAFLK